MRIIIITNLFPNPVQLQRSTFNENQFLSLAQLADIELISPISWTEYFRFSKAQRMEIKECKLWKNEIRVSFPIYFFIPIIFRALHGVAYFISILPAWLRIKRQAKDLIFASWAYPDGFAGALLAKWYKLPVVIKVHGSDVEILSENSFKTRLTLWGLHQAKHIVSVSSYLKEFLVAKGIDENKISVIRNGIDKSMFSIKQLEINEKYFVYIGNLKKDKGIYDLLDAVDDGLFQSFSTKLYIIGGGEEYGNVKSIINTRNLNKYIVLTGRLPHAVLSRQLSSSQFICLPSHHEGIPNVLVEAISCGVPVLATNVGGIPEIVNEINGVLVSAGDIVSLRNALIDMHNIKWDSKKITESIYVPTWQESAQSLYTTLEKYQ